MRGETIKSGTSMIFLLLEELDVSGSQCTVVNAHIMGLRNLRTLNADSNKWISSVRTLTNLEELDASNSCSINNAGIEGLTKLWRLEVEQNPHISDLNELVSLEELNVSGPRCGVGDAGTRCLRGLLRLDAVGNPRLTDINHMDNLTELDASGDCGISDAGMALVAVGKLRIFRADGNNRITKSSRVAVRR
jgi:hypothetical protein